MKKLFPLLLPLVVSLALGQGMSDVNLYQWGAATNSMHVGLRSSAGPPYVVSVALQTANPNITTNYVPTPKTYSRRYKPFSIVLRDPQGREVPLTAEGREFAEPKKPVKLSYFNSREFELVAFFGQSPNDIGSFRVSRCFRWKEAGTYELEVRVAVLRSTGMDRQLAPVPLPAVRMKLHLDSTDQGAKG